MKNSAQLFLTFLFLLPFSIYSNPETSLDNHLAMNRALKKSRECAKPPEPIECCPVEYCPIFNCCDRSERWTNVYLGVEGGFNWTVTHSVHGYNPKTDLGYCVGAILGYQFPQGVALEFEAAYRNNAVDFVDYFGLKINAEHNIWCLSWLGNVVYEIPYWCWKPFFGAGIGFSSEHAKATSFDLPSDKVTKNFSAQAIIGFDYNVWRGLDVGIEYKYLHVLSSHIDNHGLMADVKWYW